MFKRVLILVLFTFGFSLTANADLSLEQWSKFSTDDKIKALEDDQFTEGSHSHFNAIKDEPFRKALLEMADHVTNNVSTEAIEQELGSLTGVFIYGGPVPSFIEIYTINGQPVALTLSVYQYGGSTFDDSEPPQKHYDTEEEAKKAGLDTDADVSWSVHNYFEWNGKTWKPLYLDIYNEGGFHWSGW